MNHSEPSPYCPLVYIEPKNTKRPFQVVLADAEMPNVDGFVLAERIRNDEKLAETGIIMLSSAGRRGDAARCRELGVAAY